MTRRRRCAILFKLSYETRVFGLQKYPRGRRGSPAKGVDVYKACEGSNPSFCANKNPTFVYRTNVGFLLTKCSACAERKVCSESLVRLRSVKCLRALVAQHFASLCGISRYTSRRKPLHLPRRGKLHFTTNQLYVILYNNIGICVMLISSISTAKNVMQVFDMSFGRVVHY